MKTMKTFIFCITLISASTEAFAARLEANLIFKRQSNLESLNPAMTEVTDGILTIKDYKMYLRLERAMPPCPAFQFCAQVMPPPIELEFDIYEFAKTSCGDTYKARGTSTLATGVEEDVLFIDMSKAICHVSMVGTGSLKYVITTLSQGSGDQTVLNSGEAQFTVEKIQAQPTQ